MRPNFLSEADWLDEERLVNYARILCAFYAIAALVWIFRSPHFVDPNGKPLGTDFLTFWAAGKLALARDAASVYEFARFSEVQRHALPWRPGETIPYFGWYYPPAFFFVAAPLALLPYGAALAAWMAATFPCYLAVMRRIVGYRHWLLLALAFPATFLNLGHGQNGFLTAGLLGGGMLLLEKRPLIAGLLFGLLSFKPQFGFLLPLALISGRHWRAFLSAGATTAVMALASYFAFGAETWRAFFASLLRTRVMLEQGAIDWEKLQSAFAALRILGATVEAAYLAQAAVFIGAAAVVLAIWRKSNPLALKASALLVGSLLATPYVFDYDFMLLGLAIAWLAAEGRKTGFLAYEKSVLVAAFFLPLLSRSVAGFGIPVGAPMLMLILGMILRRALSAPGVIGKPQTLAHAVPAE